MLDRLRLFLNRPLDDRERVRLFVVVVALIFGVAAVLAVLDDAGPATRKARVESAPAIGADVAQAPGEEGVPSSEGSRRDVARSKQAARRFLTGYLPFTHGRERAGRIPAATAELRAELARHAPRVPAAERRRRPRVELLQSNGVSRERAQLVALVRDGRRRYDVQLELANTPSGWLVTGLGS